MSTPNSKITGVGSFLPGEPVGNDFFSEYLDTSDEWIRARTGIETRYFANEDDTVAKLAEPACLDAIAKADIDKNSIDAIVLATTTPDHVMPSTACKIQERLEIQNCQAFDLQAACSGFVYALGVGTQFDCCRDC